MVGVIREVGAAVGLLSQANTRPKVMVRAAKAAGTKAKKAAPAGPVNINTASAAELQTLPNIGPKKAKAILDHRKKNGKFTSVDGIKEVPGIGDKTFVGLKQFLKL